MHPKIKKFLNEGVNLDFGTGEYNYRYKENEIEFFKKAEDDKAGEYASKAVGLFITCLIIGWLRQPMSFLGMFGLILNTILLVIAFVPLLYFAGIACFKLIVFLLGGAKVKALSSVTIRFKNEQVVVNAEDKEDLKEWRRVIEYFKESA